MTGWEIKDTLKVQKAAQTGNNTEIDLFTDKYALSCVNADYSLLIILRKFHVQFWRDDRRILNREQGTYNNKPSQDEQWGITVSMYNIKDETGAVINMCIPNYNYTKVLFAENNEIVIESEEKSVRTNLTELWNKLTHIYGVSSYDNVVETFNCLTNQKFDISDLPKMFHTIESTQVGIMLYDQNYNCYKTAITISGKEALIYIYPPSNEPSILKGMVTEMDRQFENKFYEKALQAMYPSMIKNKKEFWLSQEEKNENWDITEEEFAKRISITSIVFEEDGSILYCNEDDIFGGGHCIEIHTDEIGNYKTSFISG